MGLLSFCHWLYDTSLAEAVRENEVLFPWFESAHVLAITVVVGSISIVDLRLLGFASRSRPVSALLREVLPVTWTAFVIALITGGTLFASNAVEYYGNFSFRMKMLLMAIAGLNMLAFHFITYRSVGRWDQSAQVPAAVRFAGGASLALWIAIIAFGRWIGFTTGF